VRTSGSTTKKPSPEEAPKAVPAPGVDPAADAAQLSERMDDMRKLLQRTGTALGAVAGAVLSGLTYARLHEIFPIPQNAPNWMRWLTLAGLAAAVLGSVWLAARFFAAQRRILIGADLSGKGLGWMDKQAARRVLREHAREEEADELIDVERRALRFERIARRLADANDGRAARVQKEADRLYGLVRIALVRAAATILENRTRRAFKGFITITAFLMAAGGIGVAFAMADYYKGQRDLATLRTECRKSEKAGVTNACAAVDSSSAIAARAKAAKAKAAAEKKGQRLAAAKALRQARATLPNARFVALQRSFACLGLIETRQQTMNAPKALQEKLLGICVPSG
jgi:hypothetical protein